MNIEQAKQDLIDTLQSLDKDKLSLSDLKLYAEILKTTSEIASKNYFEYLADSVGFGHSTYKPPVVSEMK